MTFHRLIERVERVILRNPPQDEANAALDEIGILAAKLYVKRATEGRAGFNAKFSNWVPSWKVCVGEKMVAKPVIDPFEQDRQWLTMWMHLRAKITHEYPSLFPNIPADFVELAADAPALLDANGNVIPKIPCKSREYEQVPSRWLQKAELYVDVLRLLANFDGLVPAFTKSDKRVIRVLMKATPGDLLSIEDVIERMAVCDYAVSAATAKTTRKKLMRHGYAHTPEGERSGMTLTDEGREMASKLDLD